MHLFSPSDSIVPFTIRLPKDIPKPTIFKLIGINGNEIDLSNNINFLEGVNFEDFTYLFYKGQKLTFNNQELNLCGCYYVAIEIGNVFYFSEVFKMVKEIKSDSFSNDFMKIEISNSYDIEPIGKLQSAPSHLGLLGASK